MPITKIIIGILFIISVLMGFSSAPELEADKWAATGFYVGQLVFALLGAWLIRSGMKARKNTGK